MPDNIAQYNAPTDKLQPSSAGDETIARMARVEKENIDEAGRAYGTAIKGVGEQVENYQYMQEVSQGSAALALMHNNMATQWNKTAASTDPNDTTIQQNFMDDANQKLSDWEGSFQTKRGQAWANTQADSMRNHLWEKTSADMGQRAGTAMVNNLTTTLGGYSSAAYSDPTSVDFALKQADALTSAKKEALAGTLDTKQLSQIDTITGDMKNEIVKSGIKGWADKNPQMASQILDKGIYDNYMNGDEKAQLQSYTDSQISARQTDADNKSQMQQQQKAQASDKANGEYLGNLMQGKMPSASDIIADNNLTRQQKSLWTAKDGILSRPLSQMTSPAYGDGFAQASQNVYSGRAVTPDSLLYGIYKGDLTPAGAAQIQKMAAMAKTPEGMASLNSQQQVLSDMKSQIVKGGADANDPVGVKNYNKFLNTFYTQWDKATSQGITPTQLSDPDDANYIGKLAQGYKRSDAQAISDVLKSANTAPPKATVKNWVIKDGQLIQAGQ